MATMEEYVSWLKEDYSHISDSRCERIYKMARENLLNRLYHSSVSTREVPKEYEMTLYAHMEEIVDRNNMKWAKIYKENGLTIEYDTSQSRVLSSVTPRIGVYQ
ncbi:MAG: hypothetical protein R3Y05_01285 [bacterium]